MVADGLSGLRQMAAAITVGLVAVAGVVLCRSAPDASPPCSLPTTAQIGIKDVSPVLISCCPQSSHLLEETAAAAMRGLM